MTTDQELPAQSERAAREETTFDEVARRIHDGSFYEDYDWASGPALRALDSALAALRSPDAGYGRMREALEAFDRVRACNWKDGDDPEYTEAYTLLDAALEAMQAEGVSSGGDG